jgi:hypothetical protein
MKCPFCQAPVDRKAVVCTGCNARRGYAMLGSAPDSPLIAYIKAIGIPAVLLPISGIGYLFRPTPIWLAVAGLAIAAGVFGILRLRQGSFWYQI